MTPVLYRIRRESMRQGNAATLLKTKTKVRTAVTNGGGEGRLPRDPGSELRQVAGEEGQRESLSINTSYQKLPFGSGDHPDKLFFHQALN